MFSFTLAQSEKSIEESEYKLFTEATLEGMYKGMFSKCVKGRKLGKGIIRGALKDAPRNDENLEYSRLLIIDADAGLNDNATPNAEVCHEALVSLGYSHIIYTTHSHKPEYHKYRAIVELSDDIQQHELHANVSQLIEELKAHGCSLKYAHEMDTWSQIWFLPRSNNPDLFISYGWFDGTTFEAIHVDETEEEKRERKQRSSQQKDDAKVETLEEMFTNIRTGKEYHNSLRNLSYQLAKDGVSRAIIMAMLTGAMESSQDAGSERWVTRMKELERLVDGGIERADEDDQDFEIPEEKKSSDGYTPPPLPPGRLGLFINQIMKCMPRPQIEFAFPMALGSIAAICGAKFNAYTNEFSGLNLNMTVVADTGFGKGQISKFFNALFIGGLDGKIVNLSGGDGATSFIGTNNYTAPKPLHRDLMLGRSKVVCMQEAGIMLGAKSGNADELSAYVMENYVNSAHDQFSSSRSYSSDEQSLKAFRAPAMTLILESTEESLATSLRDMNALESGYIPRQTMFKVNGKPAMNRSRGDKVSYQFDDDIVNQLRSLIDECARIQASTTFEANIIEWSDAQFNDYCDLTDYYSSEFNGDKVAKIIASRMAHKIVKFASLATVFNGWKSGSMSLDDEAWQWAKDMGKWEMDNINHNLSYMRDNNQYNFAIEHMKEKITSALNHNATSSRQRQLKVVKRSVIKDRLSSKFDELAKEARMPTDAYMDKTLKTMERLQMIRLLDGHPTCKKRNTPCVQILEGMYDI